MILLAKRPGRPNSRITFDHFISFLCLRARKLFEQINRTKKPSDTHQIEQQLKQVFQFHTVLKEQMSLRLATTNKIQNSKITDDLSIIRLINKPGCKLNTKLITKNAYNSFQTNLKNARLTNSQNEKKEDCKYESFFQFISGNTKLNAYQL